MFSLHNVSMGKGRTVLGLYTTMSKLVEFATEWVCYMNDKYEYEEGSSPWSSLVATEDTIDATCAHQTHYYEFSSSGKPNRRKIHMGIR